MYILVLLCPISKSFGMNGDSKDIISQPSIAPFSEKKIPLESSWWVDIKNCWLQSVRLVNDDRKPLEWRQGLPWHWNWGIEQPKCTWKPEREGYNGEYVRLMHHWKSYEIYLWVRWPPRDEKMWLHSFCEIKQRRSAIFYRILRNQHSQRIYTWWTFWAYMYLWNGARESLDMLMAIFPRSPLAP